MRNVVICFTGFTERSALKQWADAIHRMGGSVRPQLVTTQSTYLEPVPEPVILNSPGQEPSPVITNGNNIAIDGSVSTSTTPSTAPQTEGRPTPKHSSYLDSRSRSQRPVTHLVARIADGDKYRAAFTLNIPIVRPAWIDDAWRHVTSTSRDRDNLNFTASDPSYLVPLTLAYSKFLIFLHFSSFF